MTASLLAIRLRKGLRCLLYLYDAPGEDFLSMAALGRKQKMQSVAGIVLMVDPFTLPGLMRDGLQTESQSRLVSEPFDHVVEVFIAAVNTMLVRGPDQRSNVPLAVILSKADALSGQWRVGKECLRPDGAWTSGSPPRASLSQPAGTARRWTGHSGVRRRVRPCRRYFACSALVVHRIEAILRRSSLLGVGAGSMVAQAGVNREG